MPAERPDMVLVQGDTTTTLAGALAAFYQRVPVGHVEAGLRTGDLAQPFPEEMNRVVTTRLAALHFAPHRERRRQSAGRRRRPRAHLRHGQFRHRRRALRARRAGIRAPARRRNWPQLDAAKKLIVVTAHRRENFGDGFERICEALARLARRDDVQLVYPVHRNPNVMDPVHRQLAGLANVFAARASGLRPVRGPDAARDLLIYRFRRHPGRRASLGKPILVMREKTERPEAVDAGTVKLVGTDEEKIVSEAAAAG